MNRNRDGMIFDIQRWSLHDGPGIRTNVFLKGCPLSCLWCSNPESQENWGELAYFKDKCIGCGSCVKNCPHGAVTAQSDTRLIDYKICRDRCYRKEGGFSCTSVCYAKALTIMGKRYTVQELMDEILRDSDIYERSGGGVTVTGGEPFAQPEFLLELLKAAKEEGLHTAIETCSYADWKDISSCLEYLDFIFMDFKVYDSGIHKRCTGVDNRLILQNMKRINGFAHTHSLKIVVRTPVIPGINDTREEIGRMADFIREQLPDVKIYQLLPYHRLGRGKYTDIGKKYQLYDMEVPTDIQMGELEQVILEHGLDIRYE